MEFIFEENTFGFFKIHLIFEENAGEASPGGWLPLQYEDSRPKRGTVPKGFLQTNWKRRQGVSVSDFGPHREGSAPFPQWHGEPPAPKKSERESRKSGNRRKVGESRRQRQPVFRVRESFYFGNISANR